MSPDGADVAVPISTGEWLLSFWDQHLEARKDPNPARRPLEAVVQPGEVIFVPHGYWHMVVNLDDCIALTHNYVSTSNLENCLHFLREKKDQISGVRDRADAVDANAMYDLFVSELSSSMVMETGKLEAIISRSKKKGKEGLSSVLPQKRKIKLTVFDTEAPEKKQEHEEPFSFSFF